MRVRAFATSPPAPGLAFGDRFGTPEATLTSAWLRGLEVRAEETAASLRGERSKAPGLADRAGAGELPVLPWKGGVPKAVKNRAARIGATQYLAMWRGLRGEDLDIDLADTPTLTCSRFGVTVSFTMNAAVLGGVQ